MIFLLFEIAKDGLFVYTLGQPFIAQDVWRMQREPFE